MKKCKLVILNHGLELGGAEMILLDWLRYIDRERFLPILIVPHPGPLMEEATLLGITCRIVSLNRKFLRLKRTRLGPNLIFSAFLIPFFFKLKKLFTVLQADIIMTNSTKAHIYGSIVARWMKLPLVWRLNDVVDERGFHAAIITLIVYTAKIFPTLILCGSNAVQEPLLKGGVNPNKLQILYNGLNPTVWECSYYQQINNKPIVIANIGRLTPLKGQDIFINAAIRLCLDGDSKIRFLIVGQALYDLSDFEEQLKLQVERASLTKLIRFTGFVRNIPRLLQEVDIIAHTSVLPDSFPTTILEGMAAGKAIIASDCGGAREMIKNGVNGILVPPKDEKALFEAMLKLKENPALIAALGRAARCTLESQFHIHTILSRLENCLIHVSNIKK